MSALSAAVFVFFLGGGPAFEKSIRLSRLRVIVKVRLARSHLSPYPWRIFVDRLDLEETHRVAWETVPIRGRVLALAAQGVARWLVSSGWVLNVTSSLCCAPFARRIVVRFGSVRFEVEIEVEVGGLNADAQASPACFIPVALVSLLCLRGWSEFLRVTFG